MAQSNRVEFANFLRGFAAFVVMFYHYVDVFFTRREAVVYLTGAPLLPLDSFAIPLYTKVLKCFPFDLGAFGVAVFFLVSGFVIPFSLKGRSVRGFLLGRLFRIYPVYIAGFSVSVLFIYICASYFSLGFPLGIKEIVIHYLVGLRDLLGSRSIDGVIWTLEIEVKFYLVFALGFWLFGNISKILRVAPVLIFFLGVGAIKFFDVLQGLGAPVATFSSAVIFSGNFIVFMFIGVSFNALYQGFVDRAEFFFWFSLCLAMFAFQFLYGPLRAIADVHLPAYGAAVTVFGFSYYLRHLFKDWAVSGFFADISYPLYVIHGVSGYVMMRILLDLGVKAWVSITVTMSVFILLAWSIHKFVEVPAQFIGKKISRRAECKFFWNLLFRDFLM